MFRTTTGIRLAILLCSFVALPAASGALPVGSPQDAAAVEGQWTWTSGSDRIVSWRVYGFHGTKGVAAPGNRPGARQSSVSWRDASGNLWLFGGVKDEWRIESPRKHLNDLWRWDGVNWTWISSSDEENQPGIYGTKGMAAPTNVPGARKEAVSWTGANGGFWLFGGQGYTQGGLGQLNDLWRWDGTSWTWIAGSDTLNQPGIYGTKGIPSPSNVPGARERSVSWTDANGNLWLFGGYRSAQDGGERLNDLWKWDGTSWTWMSGSNAPNQPGTYGTKGTAAPGNAPGARSSAVTWTGASGEVWLFGGFGYGATGVGFLNDLWRWDGTNWTWMSGSDAVNQPGTYGTKGVAASGNVPGSRSGAASWTDADGSLWLFGGYDTSPYWSGALDDLSDIGLRNDLWRWDGTNWTWVSGSDDEYTDSEYGTKGVPAPGNMPGARSNITGSGNCLTGHHAA